MTLKGFVQTHLPPTVKQPSAYKPLTLSVPFEPVLNQRRYLHVNLSNFPNQTDVPIFTRQHFHFSTSNRCGNFTF